MNDPIISTSAAPINDTIPGEDSVIAEAAEVITADVPHVETEDLFPGLADFSYLMLDLNLATNALKSKVECGHSDESLKYAIERCRGLDVKVSELRESLQTIDTIEARAARGSLQTALTKMLEEMASANIFMTKRRLDRAQQAKDERNARIVRSGAGILAAGLAMAALGFLAVKSDQSSK